MTGPYDLKRSFSPDADPADGRVSGPFDPAWAQLVRDAAGKLGVAVSADQAQQMAWCAGELQRWNRRVNLTSITDTRQVAVKHFVDALAGEPWLPPGARVLDVGTGAGFPGLPLRIVRPDIDLTLIDAVRKKVSFVAYLVAHLNLSQTRARHVRLETLAAADRDRFDVVVSRALGPLARWLEAAVAMLAEGGRVLALKGPEGERELAALAGRGLQGGTLTAAGRTLTASVKTYRLPVFGDRRTLICLQAEDLSSGRSPFPGGG